MAVDEEQPGDGRFTDRAGHEAAGELRELLPGAYLERVGVLHELRGPTRRRPVELVEAVLFAREVPVDGAFGYTRLLCDLGCGGLVIASRGEQLERRPHEPLASEVGLGHRARI